MIELVALILFALVIVALIGAPERKSHQVKVEPATTVPVGGSAQPV